MFTGSSFSNVTILRTSLSLYDNKRNIFGFGTVVLYETSHLLALREIVMGSVIGQMVELQPHLMGFNTHRYLVEYSF